MRFNDDDTPFPVIDRAKRDHTKNKGKESHEETRNARIRRKEAFERIEDDEDWRDYLDR